MQLSLLLKVLPLAVFIHLLSATAQNYAYTLQVGIYRSLNVRHTTGKVLFGHGIPSKPASIGTKLQAVGDTIRTEKSSSAILDVDTTIGAIKIAEKTTLQIKELKILPDGGRVTRLSVTGGQARLQLRRFTHKTSRLEVVTPAGVSGVRGTEFGVMAQPGGKTGVVTLSGSVETMAQGQSVFVHAGFQTIIIPGEAPLPATPLKDDPTLKVYWIRPISDRQVTFSGQTDTVNVLLVNDTPQNTDRNGRFELTASIINNRVKATVITPLGNRRDYSFTRPK